MRASTCETCGAPVNPFAAQCRYCKAYYPRPQYETMAPIQGYASTCSAPMGLTYMARGMRLFDSSDTGYTHSVIYNLEPPGAPGPE